MHAVDQIRDRMNLGESRVFHHFYAHFQVDISVSVDQLLLPNRHTVASELTISMWTRLTVSYSGGWLDKACEN